MLPDFTLLAIGSVDLSEAMLSLKLFLNYPTTPCAKALCPTGEILKI